MTTCSLAAFSDSNGRFGNLPPPRYAERKSPESGGDCWARQAAIRHRPEQNFRGRSPEYRRPQRSHTDHPMPRRLPRALITRTDSMEEE
jgi:hypothetical protein